MKLIFSVTILLILLSSCSTVKYRSSGRIPINLLKGDSLRVRNKFVAEGVVKSYLWGLVPAETVVNIDEVILGSNITYLEAVRVHEYRSFGNLLLSWISFGMYVPINYKIIAVSDIKDYRGALWY